MTVDGHLDGAAAMGDLETLVAQTLLDLSDATLHLLGLFEELAYACHSPATFGQPRR